LERGPRGVRVTKFGDVFYKRARSITAQFRRARQDLDDLKDSTAGQVALGVTPGPGVLDRIVPEAIARVDRKRPALRFEIRSGSVHELLAALHQGEMDLLFTVLDEQLKGPDLKIERLFEDHFTLVVNCRHPLLKKSKITLEDLTSYRWTFLQDAMSLWQAVEELARQQKLTPRASIEATMIAKTDCIGVLPSYAAQIGAESGTITFVPLERMSDHRVLPRLVRPMGLVYSALNDLTPAGEALLRSIKGVCQELQLSRRKR
jgi:DNA-binding transcriptional LysR family regulator